MKLEYLPTADDVFSLRRALHARRFRHPLMVMVFAGAACTATGGAMMAATGSLVWITLPLAAFVGAGALWASCRRLDPARPPDERESSPWLRSPYRVEVDADGLRYDRGPFHAVVRWAAFDRLVETPDQLVLLERRGPGAMAYGLAKRELDRAGGTASWRDFIAGQLRSARRRDRDRVSQGK
jgi:hypothetical protein